MPFPGHTAEPTHVERPHASLRNGCGADTGRDFLKQGITPQCVHREGLVQMQAAGEGGPASATYWCDSCGVSYNAGASYRRAVGFTAYLPESVMSVTSCHKHEHLMFAAGEKNGLIRFVCPELGCNEEHNVKRASLVFRQWDEI